MNPQIEQAYAILENGDPISRELADELALLDGEETLDLVSLANKVRNRFAAEVHCCSIVNAKSGLCGENCRFCAQSLHHGVEVERYPLMTEPDILAQAHTAHAEGVSHFGIVTSGKGYPEPTPEFETICGAIAKIHEELPQLEVCASLGMLGPETTRMLAACRIAHYNINLQVAPRRYAELIADTHSVDDRTATIRLLREQGITVCCGAILGVGDTMADRVELAFAMHELDLSVIPLNVLIPIAGTPLEGAASISAMETAKTFALFRLIHPRKILKFAAGRETRMKDFQGLLMLAGMNGMLTGGYLTTRGRETTEDKALVEELRQFGQ
jgi:biotin synthase